jgi:hypothetical protein
VRRHTAVIRTEGALAVGGVAIASAGLLNRERQPDHTGFLASRGFWVHSSDIVRSGNSPFREADATGSLRVALTSETVLVPYSAPITRLRRVRTACDQTATAGTVYRSHRKRAFCLVVSQATVSLPLALATSSCDQKSHRLKTQLTVAPDANRQPCHRSGALPVPFGRESSASLQEKNSHAVRRTLSICRHSSTTT